MNRSCCPKTNSSGVLCARPNSFCCKKIQPMRRKGTQPEFQGLRNRKQNAQNIQIPQELQEPVQQISVDESTAEIGKLNEHDTYNQKIFVIGMFAGGGVNIFQYFQKLGFSVGKKHEWFQFSPHDKILFNLDRTQEILLKNNEKEIKNVIQNHDVLGGFPYMYIYEWLYKQYPNAKFIIIKSNVEKIWELEQTNWEKFNLNDKLLQLGYEIPGKNDFLERYNQFHESVSQFFKDKNCSMVINYEKFLDDKFEVIQNLMSFCSVTPDISNLKKQNLNKLSVCILVYLNQSEKSIEHLNSEIIELVENVTSGPNLNLKILFGYNENNTIINQLQENLKLFNQEYPIYWHKLQNNKKSINFQQMCQAAVNLECNTLMLLNNEVRMTRQNWYETVTESFCKISAQNHVPFGVGCIALKDSASPSYPQCIVITKMHLQIFDQLVPENIPQNEVLTFIIELYRRYGLLQFTKQFFTENKKGGLVNGLLIPGNQHKIKQNTLLPSYWQKSEEFKNWQGILQNKFDFLQKKLAVALISPCTRLDKKFFQQLQDLIIPNNVSLRIVLVIDKPIDRSENSKNVKNLREIETQHGDVRILVHEKNTGVSIARGTGWYNCDSDYLIFLDDDVIPQRDIVIEYTAAIFKYPNSTGYIGLTRLPFDGRFFSTAFHMAGISYVWHIAEFFGKFQKADFVPWGVGANFMFKWCPTMEFDARFPKTGGGEDIDMCIQAGAQKQKLAPVPDAVVLHPWRTNIQQWQRLFDWTVGDGNIVDKYPQILHMTFPNIATTTLILIMLSVLILPLTIIQHTYKPFITIVGSIFIVQIVYIICATYLVYSRKMDQFITQGQKPEGMYKLLVALFSSLMRAQLSWGQTMGHLMRGKPMNLFKRYDFMLGMIKECTREENSRSQIFFFSQMLSILCWATFVYFYF